jgi:hypothetical protein
VLDEEAGTAVVTVDQGIISLSIEAAEENVTVIIPGGGNIGVFTATLAVQNIIDMAERGIILTVRAGGVQYDMPAPAVDIASVMAALGAADPAKVLISVIITTDIGDEKYQTVSGAIQTSDAELVLPPVEFSVVASYNENTAEVKTFSQFVCRTIEITEEDAQRVTTAIVIEPDGIARHVPTDVFMRDNKWYAAVNSLTNSTYALVYNEVSFVDAVDKWFESVVNEMGSRKIVRGIGNSLFDGERPVTRAEAATIIVRALGLPLTGDGTVFLDVPAGAWFTAYIGTAYGHGLVNGAGGGMFEPNKPVTYEDAMEILQRMAEIAGADTGGYALSDDGITRAEFAEIALKLLRDAGLIGVWMTERETEPRKEPEPDEEPEGGGETEDPLSPPDGGDAPVGNESGGDTVAQAMQLLGELLDVCNASKVI